MPEDKIKLKEENIKEKVKHLPNFEIGKKNENIEKFKKETKEDNEYITEVEPFPVDTKSVKKISKDEKRVKQIEEILSDDLDEIYMSMDEELQQNFKKKGEETARKINQLLKKTKIKIKQIINLIKDWLKMIPGVNKFFVEQESKIKCDELLKL